MASKGVNKVILIGGLGADPVVRYMPNGNPVVNISLATTEKWTDKQSGQPQEKTEWHRLAVFGKPAEILGEYAKKGSQIYFEGRLSTRPYEKDGVKHFVTEIIVDQRGEMQLLGRAPNSEEGGNRQQAPRQQAPREQAPRRQGGSSPQPQRAEHPDPSPGPVSGPVSGYPDYDSFDDDHVPF